MRFAFVLPRFTLTVVVPRSRAAVRRCPPVDPSGRWPARFAVWAWPHDIAGWWTLNILANRLTLERMALTDPLQISCGDARRVADWNWSRGVRRREGVLASQREQTSRVMHDAVDMIRPGPIQGRVSDVVEVSGMTTAIRFQVGAAIGVLLHELSALAKRCKVLAMVIDVVAPIWSLVLMVKA